MQNKNVTVWLALAQVREDLRGVCLEAWSQKTADGKQAVILQKQADRLLERCEQV